MDWLVPLAKCTNASCAASEKGSCVIFAACELREQFHEFPHKYFFLDVAAMVGRIAA